MTIVAHPTLETITIDTITYPAIPFECNPEAVAARVGDLVIAQQVRLSDGAPLAIPEPLQHQNSMPPEAWEAYLAERSAQLRQHRDSGEALPMLTLPPTLGTARLLGAQAAYFALDRGPRQPVRIVPFGSVPANGELPASGFRLYDLA